MKESEIKISCCIPGGSFMPEGESSTDSPFDRLTGGYRVITSLGYDEVEATVGLIMQLTDDDMTRLTALRNEGKFSLDVCNSFIGLPIVTDENGTKELYAYVERAMGRMHMLGVKTVVFGSGRARTVPEGADPKKAEAQIDAFLMHCNTVAETLGMTVVIEPLNKRETNWVNTVRAGAEVVRRLNLPHIRLLADGFHMAIEGEDVGALTENADILIHTHIAAAPDRSYPGKNGGEYEREFLRALKKAGYHGTVTVECGYFNDFAKEAEIAAKFLRTEIEKPE